MKAIAVFGIGPIKYPLTIQREIDRQKSPKPEEETEERTEQEPEEAEKQRIEKLKKDIIDYQTAVSDNSEINGQGFKLQMEARLNGLAIRIFCRHHQIDKIFILGARTREPIPGLEELSKTVQPNPSEAEMMHFYAKNRGLEDIKTEYEEYSSNTTTNLVYLTNLLEGNHDLTELFLICSPFHMERAARIYAAGAAGANVCGISKFDRTYRI